MLEVLPGDALERLREMPDESVHCCVTSPPYWGLRDYGTAAWEGGDSGCDHAEPPRGGRNPETAGKQLTNAGTLAYQFAHECGKCGARRIDSQLGLEKTPEEYVANMVEVFREVRRVLRKDGTLWMNLGDSYWNGGGEKRDGGHGFVDGGKPKLDAAKGSLLQAKSETLLGLKPKDLCGIPWRVAFALQADGWWLRSDIIWAKPNPMPESVTDRPTKSHEYLFLLTNSANYYYDAEAIKEKGVWPEGTLAGKASAERHALAYINSRPPAYKEYTGFRNKRSVWTISTQPYPEAHFATFPEELPKLCILAGTSAKGCCAKCGAPWERVVDVSYSNWADGNNNAKRKGGEFPEQRMTFASGKRCDKSTETLGWQPTCECERYVDGRNVGSPDEIEPCTVMDPFAGSGTTGMVAIELGRKAVLIELNPKYIELIEQRCNITPGLALA